ncbi:uncharacterized protein LOC141660240 [Apium graveolens]|uniref:uncharacterized protein LOC141660240 n=1 Tax=Apium graveolens TaxID=4045 RepID=UPI003D79D5E1
MEVHGLPWCIIDDFIGDFNYLMAEDEKKRRVRHPRALLSGFSEIIMEYDLVNLGFTREKFTWEWAEVIIHEMSTSDHMPIFLQLNKQVYIPKGGRFRFENMWIKDKECYNNIIKDCWWDDIFNEILEKMARCIRLEEWGGDLIKDLKRKLITRRRELQIL